MEIGMDADSDPATMGEHVAPGMVVMESRPGGGTGFWFGVTVVMLALALATFHLRCEVAASGSPAHAVLVLGREAMLAAMVVLLALECARSRYRWVRFLPLAAALSGALMLWCYQVYVLCRSDYPRIPGELLASAEGATFLRGAVAGIVSYWDLAFLLPLLAVGAGARISRSLSLPWYEGIWLEKPSRTNAAGTRIDSRM